MYLPQGAAITGILITCAWLFGAIGIVSGGTEVVSGIAGHGIDGRELSASESNYRVEHGTGTVIKSSVNVMTAAVVSVSYKQIVPDKGASGAKVSADDIKFTDKFNDPKYTTQVTDRLWNNQKIADAINSPYKVVDSANKFTGNIAKVYFITDTHYVVLDTVTNKIVQVSDLRITDWVFTPGNFTK